jgi:hypothetical protein
MMSFAGEKEGRPTELEYVLLHCNILLLYSTLQ